MMEMSDTRKEIGFSGDISLLEHIRSQVNLEKKGRNYFRFLNSFTESTSVMYSNPFSMSCDASVTEFAVLQW